jgi:hypothetical protein
MSPITEVLKVLTTWRDWLAHIGSKRQIDSDPFDHNATPLGEEGRNAAAASERHERSYYIYGLPPM